MTEGMERGCEKTVFPRHVSSRVIKSGAGSSEDCVNEELKAIPEIDKSMNDSSFKRHGVGSIPSGR